MSEDKPPKLPPGYYLENFHTVLQGVEERYGDLLHPEERARLGQFQRLPKGARRLYVRMLTREGPWFRPDKLEYPDIPEGPAALAALLEHGFCLGPEQAGPEALVALLRKEELAAWLRTFSVPFARTLPRAALAQALLGGVEGSRLQAALGASLRPVAPACLDWVRLLFFLFFGNGDQDLTAFILADLGRVRYESYVIDPGHRLFETRQDVDFLLTLHTLASTHPAFHTLDVALQIAQNGVHPAEGRNLGTLPAARSLLGIVLEVFFQEVVAFQPSVRIRVPGSM
jgi:hypothetical protein